MATRNYRIYAVDFDGTLCKNAWPEIGEPYSKTIEHVKKLRQNGDKIILWTCREGNDLEKAISWCAERGLIFDAVNDNLEEIKVAFGGNSRKIVADFYMDDRALRPVPM